MNFTCSEVENMSISTNYYEFIKQIYESLVKYLKHYITETSDYYKKILKNQEKYAPKLKGVELLKKIKNIDTYHILSICNKIFSVIDLQKTSLQVFIKEAEEIIKSFEKTLKEKNTMSSKYLNDYEECKNSLVKKYKDIDKAKNLFFDKIAETENLLFNFYLPKKLDKKNPDSQIITKSQVDNNVKITKKHEAEYMNLVKSAKNYEDKFFDLTGNSIDNMKRISCEIMTKMKDNIANFLFNLQNCFKIPIVEIETFLPSLLSLDENKKIEEIIDKTYKNDNKLIRVKIEKYETTIINKYNEKISNNEEFLGYFVEDDEIIKTIKTMENNFNLFEKGAISKINTPEKLRCKFLTLKLLSFSTKIIEDIKNMLINNEINYINNTEDKKDNYSITDEEVKELFSLLEKKENKMVFLKQLNNFRKYGLLEIPKPNFDIICNIFNFISNNLIKDKYFEEQTAVLILCETYYIMENDKKVYILDIIKHNKIFHQKEFWNDFINKTILKEVQRNLNNYMRNHTGDMSSSDLNYDKLVFAQILPIIKTMVEFELDNKMMNELLGDLVAYYKLDNNSRKSLYDMVNFKGTEKQGEIKDKYEKFLGVSCVMEDEEEYKESVYETIKSINDLKLQQQNKKEEEKENEENKEKEEKKETKEKEEKGEKEDKEGDLNSQIIKNVSTDEFEKINQEMIKEDIEEENEEEIEENNK